MCGIFFLLSCRKCYELVFDKIAVSCRSQLQKRGPDKSTDISIQVGDKSCCLIGSVLWMQGLEPTPQPISDSHGNLLLWNGEIFNEDRPRDVSDTTYLSSILSNASSSAEVISVLASLKGPFSIVYLEQRNGRVWFARDRIGRHSLLFRREGEGLAVSSVGGGVGGWVEVPTAGFFCVDLTVKDLPLTLLPWSDLEPDPEAVLGATISNIVVRSPLASSVAQSTFSHLEKSASEEYSELLSRIYAISIPHKEHSKSTLFPFNNEITPAIDSKFPKSSSSVQSLQERTLSTTNYNLNEDKKLNSQLPKDPSSVDKFKPPPNTNLSRHDETPSQDDEELFTTLKVACQMSDVEPTALVLLQALSVVPRLRERAERLEELLSTAVRRRVEAQPGLCASCVGRRKGKCMHAKIGILFSGGLDSSILAALADRWVPKGEPIELVNVSFERVRNSTHPNDTVGRAAQSMDTPDRVTGKQTLAELRITCPDRCWRFVEVNVSRVEMSARLADTVAPLILPRTSVLDESLGLAVWFAARGVGSLDDFAANSVPMDQVSTKRTSEEGNDFSIQDSVRADGQYSCSARVLLMGTGADEQLGGYQRHRKTLARSGWTGLADAMWGDLENLPARNLGRDDRCASDSGRAPRHPYLDEDVVTFLAAMPVAHRSWLTPSLPAGVGDKYLLRLVALRLRLLRACTFPKRAMQFGSRAADPRQRGDDSSISLA